MSRSEHGPLECQLARLKAECILLDGRQGEEAAQEVHGLLQRSLAIAKRIGMKSEEPQILTGLARYYHWQGRETDARQCSVQAEELAAEMGISGEANISPVIKNR